jgi:hypothetical protein
MRGELMIGHRVMTNTYSAIGALYEDLYRIARLPPNAAAKSRLPLGF